MIQNRPTPYHIFDLGILIRIPFSFTAQRCITLWPCLPTYPVHQASCLRGQFDNSARRHHHCHVRAFQFSLWCLLSCGSYKIGWRCKFRAQSSCQCSSNVPSGSPSDSLRHCAAPSSPVSGLVQLLFAMLQYVSLQRSQQDRQRPDTIASSVCRSAKFFWGRWYSS